MGFKTFRFWRRREDVWSRIRTSIGAPEKPGWPPATNPTAVTPATVSWKIRSACRARWADLRQPGRPDRQPGSASPRPKTSARCVGPHGDNDEGRSALIAAGTPSARPTAPAQRPMSGLSRKRPPSRSRVWAGEQLWAPAKAVDRDHQPVWRSLFGPIRPQSGSQASFGSCSASNGAG